MLPNANELVNTAERAHIRPVLDRDVPGESHTVSEDDVVPDTTVVRDMRVGHQQTVVPDARGEPAGPPATQTRPGNLINVESGK